MAAKRHLEAADLDRLSKLCGLFGSDHAGERANAAGLADRFIRERGWQWRDVLAAPILAPPASRPPPDPWPSILAGWPERWKDAVALCQAAGAGLSPKNVAFLASIASYERMPSARQLEWLVSVIGRVRAEHRP